MKALLVYPTFPPTFWSFAYALPFVRKRAALPPLGLLTVAAMLPAAWPKRLVDLNVEPLKEEDLAWADLVFIGAMAVQRRSAEEVIARGHRAGKRVVCGGPLFTVEPESFPQADHLVLGEAEATLPPFLEDLARGEPQRVYRPEGFPPLERTPVPAWDLIDLRRYATLSIQFSRGCPFSCDFCNVTALFGHRPRQKSAAQVLAELDELVRRGWRGPVFFVDDNLIGNRASLRSALLPALIAWRRGKKGLPFNTEVSIDLADDPELMALMVQAGFNTVFVGIETPVDESLRECRKTQNRRDLLASVKSMQRAGLQVQGGFIVGFDSDPLSIFQKQIDFIQRSGIVTAMVGLLQAPPGTRLFERLKAENRLLGRLSGDNTDGSTNILPRMGLEALLEGYRSILRHIYSPRGYYRRVLTFLREYRDAAGVEAPLDLQRFLAFFRSLVRLGVLGRERFHYWRLLAWTVLRRPRLFPLAMTLAIQGYHFRKVCEPLLKPAAPAPRRPRGIDPLRLRASDR